MIHNAFAALTKRPQVLSMSCSPPSGADHFTDEEVDEMYHKKGNFSYMEFTHILKHGAKDKDD